MYSVLHATPTICCNLCIKKHRNQLSRYSWSRSLMKWLIHKPGYAFRIQYVLRNFACFWRIVAVINIQLTMFYFKDSDILFSCDALHVVMREKKVIDNYKICFTSLSLHLKKISSSKLSSSNCPNLIWWIIVVESFQLGKSQFLGN